MIRLGVNIDHVATVRQARRTYEPDPLWAAVEAQLGGADCITLHLREDRRHVQDDDLTRIKAGCHIAMNLEMGATDEMVRIAAVIRPDIATLVPEGRAEITTEGGLDVAGQQRRLTQVVRRLQEAGIRPSAFIDADPAQVEAAATCGFAICEIHTGPYAQALESRGHDLIDRQVANELDAIAAAGQRIAAAPMRFNAGHALNYANVRPIAAMEHLAELHIGLAIVSRALFIGLRQAVADMKRLIGEASGP